MMHMKEKKEIMCDIIGLYIYLHIVNTQFSFISCKFFLQVNYLSIYQLCLSTNPLATENRYQTLILCYNEVIFVLVCFGCNLVVHGASLVLESVLIHTDVLRNLSTPKAEGRSTS